MFKLKMGTSMKSVIQFEVARQPVTGANVQTDVKGLYLLPRVRGANTVASSHPLSAVLIQRQLDMMGLQLWPYGGDSAQDSASQTYRTLLAGTTDAHLDEVLNSLPDRPGLGDTTVARIGQFFTEWVSDGATARITEFLTLLGEEAVATTAAQAASHLDVLKARGLIHMAMGQSSTEANEVFSELRAIAAFCAAITPTLEKAKVKSRSRKAVIDIPSTGPNVSLAQFMIQAPLYAPEHFFKRASETYCKDSVRSSVSDTAEEKALSCECVCEPAPCRPPDTSCPDIDYFIGDLMELREETLGYVPSKLSYIENVPVGIRRKRNHEFSKTIELYQEDEQTVTQSEERDLSVADKTSLREEMQKDLSFDASLTFEMAYPKVKLKLESSVSRKTSEREVREKVRESVERSVQKLETINRSLSSRRQTTQMKETNLHDLDNREGDKSYVHKYFYTDELLRGQVMSHGLQLHLKMLLPSPWARLVELQKRNAAAGLNLEEPEKPMIRAPLLKPAEGQSWEEYHLELMQTYGLDNLAAPPKPLPALDPIPIHMTEKSPAREITVQEGYRAIRLDRTGGHSNPSWPNSNAKLTITVAGVSVWNYWKSSSTDKNTAPMNNRGVLTATIESWKTSNKAHITARVVLAADPVDYTPWQEAAHAAILAAYEEKLAAYQAALDEKMMREQQERDLMHPLHVEKLIRTELKHAAILMMCEKTGDDLMNWNTAPCGLPSAFKALASERLKEANFFDKALDWNFAEFIFYDYFRNPTCKWAETVDPKDAHESMRAFKSAGYVEIEIPARRGMADDVLTYIKTGVVWGGTGWPIDPEDETFTRVVTELRHSHGCYQDDRPGTAAVTNGSNLIILSGAEFYWIPGTNGNGGQIDLGHMTLDEGREIFIEGIQYFIQAIRVVSGSTGQPPEFELELDRPYEGADDPALKYAVGARRIGAPFNFRKPTSAIWLGDEADNCLPTYPIKC